MSIVKLINSFISIIQLIKYGRIAKFSWRNLLVEVQALAPILISNCIISSSLISIFLTLQIIRESTKCDLINDLGGVVWIISIREISPIMVAIITVIQLGVFIAKKIQTMKNYDQIDSIYLMQIDMSAFLLLPKLLASCLLLPILDCLSIITIVMLSLFVTYIIYDIDYNLYLVSILKNFYIVDIIKSITKTIVLGLFLTVINTIWEISLIMNVNMLSNYVKYFVLTSLSGIFILNVILTPILYRKIGSLI